MQSSWSWSTQPSQIRMGPDFFTRRRSSNYHSMFLNHCQVEKNREGQDPHLPLFRICDVRVSRESTVACKRWKSSGSIYFVFAQYRIVSPYHCDMGIEVKFVSIESLSKPHSSQVDCNENTAVFAHCIPHTLLPLFLDGLPFCNFSLFMQFTPTGGIT